MKLTKVLSLVLVVIMCFMVLVACKPSDDGPADGTTTGGDNTTTPPAGETTTGVITDANGYEVDNLPDMKWDKEIYIFSWQNQLGWEFNADTLTGDTVKDEIYNRKQRLSEKYGITLKIDSANGDWDHRADFVKKVEANQTEEGELAYDIVGCYFAVSGDMTVKGFFEDLSDTNKFEYLDLSKPWWPDDLLGSARINNAVYAITGDITPTYIRNMGLVHVNLDLVEKYNPGVDVYKLVENKQWTYEKLEELALGNSFAEGSDREYGLTMANNVKFDDMFYGAGFLFVNNLDDGSVELADLSSDERYLDFYEYCYKLVNENVDVEFMAINAQKTDTAGAGFAAGNSMFNFGSAADIQNYLTKVDFNLGILPMPMYNTSTFNTQDQYYTVQGFWTTLYSIPNNSDDFDYASFVLEALASDAFRHMTPTWYETMFQSRFLQTPQNAEMFNVIHDSMVFDTARIFGTQINCFSAFRQASKTKDWSSYYKSNVTTWTTNIGKINSSLGK